MTGLRQLARTPWLLGLFLLYVVDALNAAVAMRFYPATFSRAYRFVLDLADPTLWAAAWLVIGLLILVGLTMDNRLLLIVGLSAYGVACSAYAVSITTLLWDGSPGALVGALKWVITAVSSLVLVRAVPMLRILGHRDLQPG